jgi:homoserine kinase
MLILQLNTPDPDPEIFYSCLQDRLHQPYRGQILPDLQKILLLNPLTIPGLLGFCLSGAGPSIVALAKYNEDLIIEYIQKEYIQKECDSNNYSFLISNFTKTGASYKKVFKNI